ncbi:hypothetical protein AAVH_25446, partial [Aphelenchoides avenae]
MKLFLQFSALLLAVTVVVVNATGPTLVLPPGSTTCDDEAKHCAQYTQWCSAGNEWMKHLCAKTCNICPQGPPPFVP